MTSLPIRLAEAQAPRYTSYPTAPHFGAGVDGAVYRGWLAALPAEAPLSLYLHVPFCHQLCWYCVCHTAVANGYHRIAAYVALLRREIGLLGEALGEGRPVTGLHWGGGTPSILSGEDFAAVMGQLGAVSRSPVIRLSIPTTKYPSLINLSQRCDPRNPAAPVIKILF
jgi:oxygen-independent coproporphyrinogen-3 oxidase